MIASVALSASSCVCWLSRSWSCLVQLIINRSLIGSKFYGSARQGRDRRNALELFAYLRYDKTIFTKYFILCVSNEYVKCSWNTKNVIFD